MNQRARQFLAAGLAGLGVASWAMGQPQVPSGYAVQEYIRVPGATNPYGLAFCPADHPLFGGQLFVCFGNDEQGRPARTLYRVPGKGKAELLSRPANQHAAMAFPPPGSPFGDRLYAPLEPQIISYDARGSWSRLTDLGRTQMYTIRFAAGGRWGRDLYVMDNHNSSGAVHRCEANGAVTCLVANLPPHAMGMDFGPGGAWGDDLYVSLSSGNGIIKVDPNGVVRSFEADREGMGGGWHAGHAFDRTGEFGGHLFFSNLGLGKIIQVDPNGRATEFAGGFNFGEGEQSSGRLAFGPDHALYVSDGHHNCVWRISRNRLGLLRDPAADTVVLPGGQVLQGTLAGEGFVLEASFAKLDLKAAQVIGMASLEGRSVMCLLADGQIVRGQLAGEAVRLSLAGGERRTFSAGSFCQWSRRLSADYPSAIQPDGTVLVTHDGQELLVEANGVSLNLRTRWGSIRVDGADVAEVVALGEGAEAAGPRPEPDGPAAALHRVRVVGGSVLTGVLEDAKIRFAPRLGGRLEAAPGQVVRLRAGRPQHPSPWWTRAEMAGGDVLAGSLAQDSLSVRTQGGLVQVPAAEIRQWESVPAIDGGVRLRLWDGNIVTGLAERQEIRFRVRPGLEVRLPSEQVLRLCCPVQGSAEEFSRRLSQLVARLGAQRYQDRESATQELIGMGATVAPFLEPYQDHSDPEVRERVRLVLERLRGAAPAPPKGD